MYENSYSTDIFFSIVIVFSVGISSYFAISYTESSIIDAEIAKMNTHNAEIIHEIETLHQRASDDLVFTLKNPKFVEYFELPEQRLEMYMMKMVSCNSLRNNEKLNKN